MANNYGLLGTAAEGVREGLNAYMTNQNMQRQQQALNRANQLQNLQLGVQQDDQGNLNYTPEMQQQVQTERQAKQLTSQHSIDEFDPTSQRSQAYRDSARGLLEKSKKGSGSSITDDMSASDVKDLMPLYKQSEVGDLGLLKAQMMGGMQNQRMDLMNERLHNQNIKSVISDPTTTSLVTTAQNLQNARSAFEQGGRTPQEFAEFQQAIRANMGIKGTSGVDERGDTYWKTMGLNGDKVKQYLFGNPADVMKSDPAAVANVLQVADIEAKNKYNQAQAQIQKNARAHQSFYSKDQNADRKADFDASVQQALDQINPNKGSSGGGPGSGLVASQGAAAQSGQSDMVKIQTPDGRVGSIPRANLQRALQAGAKAL